MSIKRAILDHNAREVWNILHNVQDFSTREDLFLLPFLTYDEELTNQLLFFEYNLNFIRDGSTVLHMAAWAGNHELVAKLIQKGARVDILDEDGNTVLHRGCLTSLKVVRMLVEAGVNTDVKNKDGLTALQIVQKARYVNREIETYLTEYTRIDYWESLREFARKWLCLPAFIGNNTSDI